LKGVFLMLRILVATSVGVIVFGTCLFLPLGVMKMASGDSGKFGGAFLIGFVGLPLGLVAGVGVGILAFLKIQFRRNLSKLALSNRGGSVPPVL
jgi:hypothetical protein